MLKHLKYKVDFLNPVKTLQGDHEFTTGLTGITGPNGKGKSMNLEMIQFALHGTSALRGKMEGYGKIEVALDFELKGDAYLVTRTKTNAKLIRAGVDLAVGTKPVNQKIEELFGYSADVFRVANVCNQGKIEELGDMKPTARKQLIDETVGLNVLDELNTFIDDERKRLKNGISAIEGMITAPVAPMNPELAKDSAHYKGVRDMLQVVRDKRNVVSAAAARVLTEPEKKELHSDDAKLEQYVSSQQRRAAIMTEYELLDRQKKALPKAIENLVTELEADDGHLEAYQKNLANIKYLKTEISVNKKGAERYKWTEPVMLKAEIEAYEARNILVGRWEQKQKLIAKRVPHDCPKCEHHWDDEDPRIKTEYADVPEEKPTSQFNASELSLQILNTANKEAATPILLYIDDLEEKLKQLVAEDILLNNINRITTTRTKFAESKASIDVAARRAEIEQRLTELMAEFDTLPDRTGVISAINEYRRLFHKYEVQLEAYDAAVSEKEKAQIALNEFSTTLDEDIQKADNNYTTVLTYETNLENYKKAKATYDKAVEQLQGLKDELVDWENGRSAIVDLRAKVKGYLLPSLNSVSSTLINQMTGGELTWVQMNDQGEILIEGQGIETLSGAGKAVANLALRIGLGQVLTNRVFSVMMLDEIDASCDEDRAKYIAGCLMNLTKTIKQVVQVSHKQGLPADQYVRL